MRIKCLIFVLSGFDLRSSPKNCHIMKVNQEDGLLFLARNKEQVCHCRFQSDFFFTFTSSSPQHHFWMTTTNVGQGLLFFIWFYRNVRIFWHRVGTRYLVYLLSTYISTYLVHRYLYTIQYTCLWCLNFSANTYYIY